MGGLALWITLLGGCAAPLEAKSPANALREGRLAPTEIGHGESGPPTPFPITATLTASITITPTPTRGPAVTPRPPSAVQTRKPTPTIDLHQFTVWWLDFETPKLGSALVEFGASQKQELLRTEDGGSTWFDITPGGASQWEAYLPYAFDADSILVVATTTDVSPPNSADRQITAGIYRTDDGGHSWEMTGSMDLARYWPVQLDFVDRNHGWMATYGGVALGSEQAGLYGTKDGGRSWTFLMTAADEYGNPTGSGLPFSGLKNGIGFVDDHSGWWAGESYGYMPYLYATNDGGLTWARRVSLPVPPGYPEDILWQVSSAFYIPEFVQGRDGHMLVSVDTDPHAFWLYRTDDGGINWEVSVLPGPPDCGPVFISARHGWFISDSQIYFTRDGGSSWTVLARLSTTTTGCQNLEFLDLSHGWMMGDGVLYGTQDGGEHWATITSDLAGGN
jgi:photosystem II stability/assembly factor-like uncharacterized protein